LVSILALLTHSSTSDFVPCMPVIQLPFVLYGVPKLDEASKAWTDAFLRASFATMEEGAYKVER